MAPITKTLALAGALYSAFGFAAPVDKRAVVWETVTDIVWTTIDVTTTLYPQQFDAATATVVPVTTTAPVVAAVTTTAAAKAAQVEEQPLERETSTSSTSSTSTSTAAPAPTEQTTQAAAPVETTSSAASTTSEAAAAATSSSTTESTESTASTSSSGYSGSCSEGSPCTGQMTYYDTATTSSNPSSCGTTNDGETELVLALPVGIMTDSDCGKTVTIEYNGVTQTGTVVDKCMGCDDSSVDLSRAFFEAFASLSEGRLDGAKWYIN
jgi:hypothetical protein